VLVYPYDESRSLIVVHADHSRLVGQLAAWRADMQPYLPMVLAAAEHDASWRSWDMRPYLDPDGRPIDGHTAYMAPYLLDLCARAVSDVLERDAYAALIVSLHWESLLRDIEVPQKADFLGEQAALREKLIEMLVEDGRYPRETMQPALRANAEVLNTLNRLAEWLPSPETRLESMARRENGDVVLTHYPFTKEPLEVSVPARLVSQRFASHDAFLEAFFRAEQLSLRFRLRCAGGPGREQAAPDRS
jgi:uncharacterized protein DUF3891